MVSATVIFTGDLWSHHAPVDQDLAISPSSLAVTASGAAGADKAQMREVVHIGSPATYSTGIGTPTGSPTRPERWPGKGVGSEPHRGGLILGEALQETQVEAERLR